jgi:hypothetical protein
MFESLKQTIGDLLGGRVAPADRNAVIAEMKRALALAKLGVEDLAESAEVTRRRLAEEKKQLETATRRRELAEGINDVETVALAAKFEAQFAERISVLERKLDVQEAEHGLAERDYDEMLKQLKQASVGVGSGMSKENRPLSDADLGLPDDAPLRSELDALGRSAKRQERDVQADAALEALKRKMRGEA